MGRDVEVFGIDTERERETRLRIEVDQQDPLALLKQRRTQRRHRGRLGDATLLIGDRDDTGHAYKILFINELCYGARWGSI
jgi:hypothetical protein